MVCVNVGKVGFGARGNDKETPRLFMRKEYHIRLGLEHVFQVYLSLLIKYLKIWFSNICLVKHLMRVYYVPGSVLSSVDVMLSKNQNQNQKAPIISAYMLYGFFAEPKVPSEGTNLCSCDFSLTTSSVHWCGCARRARSVSSPAGRHLILLS